MINSKQKRALQALTAARKGLPTPSKDANSFAAPAFGRQGVAGLGSVEVSYFW